MSEMTRRGRRQLSFAYAAACLLFIACAWRFYGRRPPYFAIPATVVDHVSLQEHAARDALLLIPRVAPLIPRGAEVTCFRPKDGQAWNDHVNYLTAVGLLPHQSVLPPFTAGAGYTTGGVEYVIAIREPFAHPSYVPVAGFPNGFLYRRK